MVRGLELFMWGYQPQFRIMLEIIAKNVFAAIGFDAVPRALLVGVRKPNSDGPNPVCVEPEFESWPLSLFDGINEAIEKAYPEHSGHSMYYSDRRAMEEKPENIRREVVRAQLKQCLEPFDIENDVLSFCGWPRIVNDYYVVPILQIPRDALARYPRLNNEDVYLGRYRGSKSFMDMCIIEILEKATSELESNEPGRKHFEDRRSPEELVRRAAEHFLRTPIMATARQGKPDEAFSLNLFKSLNEVSSHMYEHTPGVGRMLLVNPDNPNVQYTLRFPRPISFRDSRWARKLLQMAAGANSLIANGGGIHGLGELTKEDPSAQDAFWVDFIGHYQWNMRLATKVIIQSRFGEPTLLIEAISENRFKENYLRVMENSTEAQAINAWEIMQTMIKEPRGSMVVFAQDAPTEAQRLSRQGMSVVPEQLTPALLASVCRIDGSVLCDTGGVCYAMGVILDGAANDSCTPARGSRYNSAVRYVLGSPASRLTIVKSEDGSLDIIPLLRPRISRKAFMSAIEALERSDIENYHKPRLYLDEHRFYALSEDCPRINSALDRLDALPIDVGTIRIGTERFILNSAMNSDYYS